MRRHLIRFLVNLIHFFLLYFLQTSSSYVNLYFFYWSLLFVLLLFFFSALSEFLCCPKFQLNFSYFFFFYFGCLLCKSLRHCKFGFLFLLSNWHYKKIIGAFFVISQFVVVVVVFKVQFGEEVNNISLIWMSKK